MQRTIYSKKNLSYTAFYFILVFRFNRWLTKLIMLNSHLAFFFVCRQENMLLFSSQSQGEQVRMLKTTHPFLALVVLSFYTVNTSNQIMCCSQVWNIIPHHNCILGKSTFYFQDALYRLKKQHFVKHQQFATVCYQLMKYNSNFKNYSDKLSFNMEYELSRTFINKTVASQDGWGVCPAPGDTITKN